MVHVKWCIVAAVQTQEEAPAEEEKEVPAAKTKAAPKAAPAKKVCFRRCPPPPSGAIFICIHPHSESF